MPDLPPALQGLRDLRNALSFGRAFGVHVAARPRLGNPLDPRVLRADARVTALRDQIGRLPATAFPSIVVRAREDFDQKLETVLAGAATSADIEALRQAAEMLLAVSLRGYRSGPPTTANGRYIIDGLTKILDAATTQISKNDRAPTDNEIAEIINQLYPIKMPGIATAETKVREIIASNFGRPAGAEQLRAVLDREDFRGRRSSRGRPAKAP
jgi:hypothetical protein